VRADSKLSFSESFFGSGVVIVDGKTYLKPLPPAQGSFGLNYQIKNEGSTNVTRVRIQETLLGRNGDVISGPEAIIDELGISPGQTRTYTGKTYPIGGEGAAFTILYSLWYQVEGSTEWILLKENGSRSIETLNTTVHASYRAQYSGSIVAGQEVLYTAELKSNANVRLENIEVEDSVFGTLGTIAVLNPGERAVVTRAFRVERTTESHIILSFNDPMGIQERIVQPISSARVLVEVKQEEPIYKLEVSGNVNKNRISSEQEVDFIFELKNTGNKELIDIKGVDWERNVFYSRDKMLPGQGETIQYRAKVKPGNSYEVVFSGISPENGEKIEASYKIEFPKVEPKVAISCKITPQEIESGDSVTLQYTLKNAGDITLVEIRVEEPAFGEIAKYDRLEPGAEKSFSIEKEIESDTEICPYVYAKDEETGAEYEFEGELQIITVKAKPGAPSLTVTLSANPRVLNEKGSVELVCTIKNDGDVTINNIEAMLKERDMNIGSILTLEPGEEKTLTLSGIGVEKDETFTALVKGRTEDGEIVEVSSSPCQVKIERNDLPKDEEQKTNTENSKLAFLKNVLAVIIVLILLTAAGLIYMIKDMGKRNKKAKKH